MTEKQPDWIDKARNHYLYDSDGEIPSKETIYADSINPNIIESKKAFREAIEKYLPKESTYESGYQKGYEDCKKKLGSNGMRLNAMQSKEEKIRQIGTEVLRQLESREYTTHEEIGNTGIYSDKLYLSINQS